MIAVIISCTKKLAIGMLYLIRMIFNIIEKAEAIHKDIMTSFMNILIYIGLAKYYFELKEDTSKKDFNKNGDGE